MNIKTIKTIWSKDDLKQNTHIIELEQGCLVVDAGCPLDEIKKVTEKPIIAVLITHGHFDHIKYIEDYDKLAVPICASKHIMKFLDDSTLNLSCWEKPTKYKLNNLFSLEDKDELDLEECKVQCFRTPGHSKDSMCYLIDNKYLFSGDTVFSVAIGRLDLPTSDVQDMIKSLNLIDKLKFETVYTGHGRVSTKQEQNQNIDKWIENLKRNIDI